MVIGRSSPFGGWTRTRVLLALRLLEESYPRQLARILDAPPSGVLKALRSLELDGLVAGRSMGRTRVFRVNPRYFAYDDLQRYLWRLTEPEDNLRDRISSSDLPRGNRSGPATPQISAKGPLEKEKQRTPRLRQPRGFRGFAARLA